MSEVYGKPTGKVVFALWSSKAGRAITLLRNWILSPLQLALHRREALEQPNGIHSAAPTPLRAIARKSNRLDQLSSYEGGLNITATAIILSLNSIAITFCA